MAEGTVKWFDATRGYGFILEVGGREILVERQHIRAKGNRSLTQGDRVEFDIATGSEGLPQAVNVRNIESPPPQGSSRSAT